LDLRFALAKKLDPRITFTRGSIGTYFGSDGLMRTAGVNEPRFDHDPITGQSLGLLVEESRTNLVRNNTAQGAVAGTPGTLPTNSYVYTAPSGTTSQVISVGTENGITYFDIRFYGVSSQNGELSWAPQTGTNTPITGGQVVSASAYLKVVSGTFANITNLTVRILDYNGASYLAESSSVVSASSLQSSTLTRYSHTRTTGGSANGVVFSITLNKTSAGPVDITLRIGMPQIEVGSFPTSVMPNSSISSTVTRSADTPNITNISSFFNSNEGTLFVDSEMPYQTNSRFPAIGFTRGAGSGNCIQFYYYNTSTPYVTYLVRDTANKGINLIAFDSPNQTLGSYKKFIATYKVGEFNYYFDGKFVGKTNTNKALPTNLTSLDFGFNAPGSPDRLNGHIRRVTYYPIQLTNQQLINLSN
jgi:hypothetical protein